jgi:glutamate synthase (NADPH/NADH) small chain
MTAAPRLPVADLPSACRAGGGFDDLHPPLSPFKAMAEAARCLYCHDAPCVTACPTSIDIPGFIRRIGHGNAVGAGKTILSANIMGGTCARVCPTEELCEAACVRLTGEGVPVAIGKLQRFATDALFDAGVQPFERAAPTGKKVAVVGAGPAGLSCAHALARAGVDVAVYEARAKAGGLNEHGLAAYKMAGNFAEAEVDFILSLGGITVETGKALGQDITLADLTAGYDAVFLGIGLGSANPVGVPGEDLDGVEAAIAFIETLRQSADPLAEIAVPDDVIVLGGGNTAIDAAIQASRLGAANVTLAYRRGEGQMGATAWELDLARANGVRVIFWAAPTRFVDTAGNGRVGAVAFERTDLVEGRLVGTGNTFEVEADLVLKAVGQSMRTMGLDGLETTGGRIAVTDYRTSDPKVFAGGDCVHNGADLTVRAVADGAKAAEAILATLAL